MEGGQSGAPEGESLTTSTGRKGSGVLLHAKHALMPNNLGYCGPDENGRIIEHLHDSTTSESLLSTLTKFEAAYPFVRMIAKSTGRKPFDYDVAEAYWIGNQLLDRVKPAQFFEFVHQGLGSRLGKEEGKALFRRFGETAKPHHTFYVLSIYGRSTPTTANEQKLLQLMDSCRISWGKVLEVKKRSLVVERSPLAVSDGRLSLAKPEHREVEYDREIPPFAEVREGDWVSLHWNFASERLTERQLRNIKAYTALDIETTNRFVDSLEGRRRLKR